MRAIIEIFFDAFLGEAPILLACITMIGYAALGKSFAIIITGGIKTHVPTVKHKVKQRHITWKRLF